MAHDAIKTEREGLAGLFYITALVLMIGYILWVGSSILIPLVVAAFLSFLIVSLKSAIRAVPVVGKFIPEFLGFILSFGVIALVLIFLIDVISDNVAELASAFPAYQEKFMGIISNAFTWLDNQDFLPEEMVASLQTLPQRGLALIGPVAGSLADGARGLATNLITILLYTVFMLLERGKVLRKISMLSFAGQSQKQNDDLIADIGNMVREYISIKSLTALINAVISYTVMKLLGVQFAEFFALVMFAFSFVPVIGAIIAVTLPTSLALVQPEGGGLQLAVMVFVLLTAAEQLVGSIIEPRLMGRSLNLSPLVILLSLATWGTLWGAAGMLLCVPMTVTIMIVMSQFHTTRPMAIMLSDDGKIKDIRRDMDSVEVSDEIDNEADTNEAKDHGDQVKP